MSNLRCIRNSGFYAPSSLWIATQFWSTTVHLKRAATWARYQQYPCRVSVSLAGLSNPHLQVLSEPLLQSSDDLLSPLKADFQWRKKPSFALPLCSFFSELPSQFSSLHSQSAHVLLLTPVAQKKTMCLIKWGITLAFSTYCLLHLIQPFILNLE